MVFSFAIGPMVAHDSNHCQWVVSGRPVGRQKKNDGGGGLLMADVQAANAQIAEIQ